MDTTLGLRADISLAMQRAWQIEAARDYQARQAAATTPPLPSRFAAALRKRIATGQRITFCRVTRTAANGAAPAPRVA
jgi:hypothetical protein